MATDSEDFQQQARGAPQPAPGAARRPRTRLVVPPKLVFAMLTGRDLQAKLRAFGLPTDGKRQARAVLPLTTPAGANR